MLTDLSREVDTIDPRQRPLIEIARHGEVVEAVAAVTAQDRKVEAPEKLRQHRDRARDCEHRAYGGSGCRTNRLEWRICAPKFPCAEGQAGRQSGRKKRRRPERDGTVHQHQQTSSDDDEPEADGRRQREREPQTSRPTAAPRAPDQIPWRKTP